MARYVGALALLFALAPACAAQTPSLQQRAQAIEAQVWSPYCPGRLLVDCTTPQAGELRTEIAKRLRRGDSSAQVLEWIRRDFGDEALARPDGSGAELAIWLVPAAIFVVGALAVGLNLRRWKRPTASKLTVD